MNENGSWAIWFVHGAWCDKRGTRFSGLSCIDGFFYGAFFSVSLGICRRTTKKGGMMDWRGFPETKKLFDRVIQHRKTCKWWKVGEKCFDCHHNTLTKIEKELGESKYRDTNTKGRE